MSERGKEWKRFSALVLKHVDNYTVPQYGDMPGDALSFYTAGDCIRIILRYCNRYGRNARGPWEQERDFLKIAHYACAAYWKEVKSNAPDGQTE